MHTYQSVEKLLATTHSGTSTEAEYTGYKAAEYTAFLVSEHSGITDEKTEEALL